MIIYFNIINNGLLHKQTNLFSCILNPYNWKDFQIQKLHRQQIKHALIYEPENSKVLQSPIELNFLVPNIFSEQLKVREYEKIQVNDKSFNYLQNSFVSMNLDIQTSEQLKRTLTKFTKKHIRIGRLLQIMDMIAGLVSYRHCFGSFRRPNPFTLVTGSVQSLQLFESINCEENLVIQGYLNYVGKTSMQAEINIKQNNKLKGNAYFTMVSRNSAQLSKGYEVPKLNYTKLNEVELLKSHQRTRQALQRIQRRKKQISESFDQRPPNQEEIKQIHELFLQRKNKQVSQNNLMLKIDTTKIQNNLVMHPQDRNVHGKIFGGYLMREMLETGWFAGNKFLMGQEFEILGMTDIYFLSAVEVGDGLTISACVSYTQANIIIVTVEALTTNFKTGMKKICCSSQLLLQTQSSTVRTVFPDSYSEALKYLISRRTFVKMFGNPQKNIQINK